MVFPGWPEKCIERYNEFVGRRDQHGTAAQKQLTVSNNCKLIRLLADNDIEWQDDGQPKAPKPRIFSDRSLSVVVTGDSFPAVEIAELIAESNGKFIGAWEFSPDQFPESEQFRICYDPYPYEEDGELRQPPKNHTQIFCNKGNPKCRAVVSGGNWGPKPEQKQVDQ